MLALIWYFGYYKNRAGQGRQPSRPQRPTARRRRHRPSPSPADRANRSAIRVRPPPSPRRPRSGGSGWRRWRGRARTGYPAVPTPTYVDRSRARSLADLLRPHAPAPRTVLSPLRRRRPPWPIRGSPILPPRAGRREGSIPGDAPTRSASTPNLCRRWMPRPRAGPLWAGLAPARRLRLRRRRWCSASPWPGWASPTSAAPPSARPSTSGRRCWWSASPWSRRPGSVGLAASCRSAWCCCWRLLSVTVVRGAQPGRAASSRTVSYTTLAAHPARWRPARIRRPDRRPQPARP